MTVDVEAKNKWRTAEESRTWKPPKDQVDMLIVLKHIKKRRLCLLRADIKTKLNAKIKKYMKTELYWSIWELRYNSGRCGMEWDSWGRSFLFLSGPTVLDTSHEVFAFFFFNGWKMPELTFKITSILITSDPPLLSFLFLLILCYCCSHAR